MPSRFHLRQRLRQRVRNLMARHRSSAQLAEAAATPSSVFTELSEGLASTASRIEAFELMIRDFVHRVLDSKREEDLVQVRAAIHDRLDAEVILLGAECKQIVKDSDALEELLLNTPSGAGALFESDGKTMTSVGSGSGDEDMTSAVSVSDDEDTYSAGIGSDDEALFSAVSGDRSGWELAGCRPVGSLLTEEQAKEITAKLFKLSQDTERVVQKWAGQMMSYMEFRKFYLEGAEIVVVEGNRLPAKLEELVRNQTELDRAKVDSDGESFFYSDGE